MSDRPDFDKERRYGKRQAENAAMVDDSKRIRCGDPCDRNYLDHLPHELAEHVADYCDPISLLAMRRVSRASHGHLARHRRALAEIFKVYDNLAGDTPENTYRDVWNLQICRETATITFTTRSYTMGSEFAAFAAVYKDLMVERFPHAHAQVYDPQFANMYYMIEVTIRPSHVARVGADAILDRINIELEDMYYTHMWELAESTLGPQGPQESDAAYRQRVEEELADEYYPK
jgi:hypothetical protein